MYWFILYLRTACIPEINLTCSWYIINFKDKAGVTAIDAGLVLKIRPYKSSLNSSNLSFYPPSPSRQKLRFFFLGTYINSFCHLETFENPRIQLKIIFSFWNIRNFGKCSEAGRETITSTLYRDRTSPNMGAQVAIAWDAFPELYSDSGSTK